MENFEPQLLDRIAVDFYLSQNQVCIDLKSLHRITEKPWCEIDANGKSFVDKLKEEMKTRDCQLVINLRPTQSIKITTPIYFLT